MESCTNKKVTIPAKKIKFFLIKKVATYITGLLITKEHRNCSNIATYLECTHDAIYSCFKKVVLLIPSMSDLLLKVASERSKLSEMSYLIVDETSILKTFSSIIEKVCYGYNSIMGRPVKSIIIVVIVWTDGVITIPIAFRFWVNKKTAGACYKKKTDIAREMLNELYNKISFNFLLMDGLYCSLEMITFCQQRKIKFIMRVPRNRCIETVNKKRAQLQKHSSLRLVRNQRNKTVHALYRNEKCFFTIEKRKNKRGKYETVFLVSNAYLQSAEYVSIYKMRWTIETVFRTLKQSFGIGECQARSTEKQAAHFFATFVAYAFVQIEQCDKSNKSIGPPEETIRALRGQKKLLPEEKLPLWMGTFML